MERGERKDTVKERERSGEIGKEGGVGGGTREKMRGSRGADYGRDQDLLIVYIVTPLSSPHTQHGRKVCP